MVVALGFQMGQERPHIVGGQIGEGELGDGDAVRLGKEEEEQTDPIAVASNGCLRKTFFRFEMMFEEHVDQTAEGFHGSTED